MSIQPVGPGSAHLFEIRTFRDARGALSVVEEGADLPFVPRRLYYLYGSDPSGTRAHHAHRAERQCMIALAGTAEVEIDTGREQRIFLLDRPDQGLLLEPAVWRVVRMGDAASVLAVLAAHAYDPDDYIHDYDEFRALVGAP
jgi:hypothetical protein